MKGFYNKILDIDLGNRKFHPARHLWGKDTYETEDKVLKEVNRPGAQAVVIDPADEKE